MAISSLRREEQIGLAVALALHAALIGALLLRPAVPALPMPQPISVTLSDDTGLTATAPSHADAAAAVAPMAGASQPEAAPAPATSPLPPAVAPAPVEPPLPAPKPVAMTRPQPEAVSRPIQLPAPRPKPHPVAKPIPREIAPPQPETAAKTPARPAAKATIKPAKKQTDQKIEDTIGETISSAKLVKHPPSVKDWSLAAPVGADRKPAGASRIGTDFLKGVAAGKASGKAASPGAAVIGPEVKSALSGAIAHQLKPHWAAPEGADADQLVTVLSWDLNADGTLASDPHVLRQEGITDSNRPQAARHAEQAIRAVRLAAPFTLPAPYFSVWKHVAAFRFDRKLSQ